MKQSLSNFTIRLPKNIIVIPTDTGLRFSGPLGLAFLNFKRLDPKGNVLFNLSCDKKNISIYGWCQSVSSLIQTVIQNKIQGVTRGFRINLRLKGIGYRATIRSRQNTQLLTLFLGFSHSIELEIPESIRVFLLEPTLICIFGIDKNQITQFAFRLKKIRPTSSGKGIFIE